jgi:hypothetical protein
VQGVHQPQGQTAQAPTVNRHRRDM